MNFGSQETLKNKVKRDIYFSESFQDSFTISLILRVFLEEKKKLWGFWWGRYFYFVFLGYFVLMRLLPRCSSYLLSISILRNQLCIRSSTKVFQLQQFWGHFSRSPFLAPKGLMYLSILGLFYGVHKEFDDGTASFAFFPQFGISGLWAILRFPKISIWCAILTPLALQGLEPYCHLH